MFKLKKIIVTPPLAFGDRTEYIVHATKLGGSSFRLSYKTGTAAKRCKEALLASRESIDVKVIRYDYTSTDIGDFQLAEPREVF